MNVLRVLFCFATLSLRAAEAEELRGRVVSSSGDGIAGVAVVSMPVDQATTGSDGRFVLHKPSEVVRFSLRSYRPVTKTLDQLKYNPEIVLDQDSEALWSPPRCSSNRQTELLKGDDMVFSLPRGVRVKRRSDIDYQTVHVRHKRFAMRLGWGPMWSYGMPTAKSYFDGLETLVERDVAFIAGVDGTEYRGRRFNGTYSRWVGIFGETVSYDQVDKDTADFFDRIIDTLCWFRR